MSARRRPQRAVWLMIALAAGCSSSAAGPDSETNWFKTCTATQDCRGAAQCLCGLCTIPCSGDPACSAAPAGAACTSLPEGPGCAGSSARGRCTITSEASDALSNPTGTCAAAGSGARVGAPLPGEGDVWLPDCKLRLSREYSRVFVRPSGSAYIVPDPLLPPQRYASACADLQHPLYDIVLRYSFCNPASTDRPSDHMTPADALTVAHYLHEGGYAGDTGMVFTALGRTILPTPFLADVVDACKLRTADDSSEVLALCQQAAAVVRREGAGADAGGNPELFDDGQATSDVAYLLNQLFGIRAMRSTLSIDPSLCGLPSDPASCGSQSTRYFYNPVTAQCEPRSYGTCGATLSDFPAVEGCRGACSRRAVGCERCSGDGCSAAGDCSGCPVTDPGEGDACTDEGLACTYGSGCSYTTCRCLSGGQRGVAWACTSTAC